MRLFDRFDKVFCINLDRRPDRMLHFEEQVKKHNLGEFERVSAVDGSDVYKNTYYNNLLPGEVGVILSNKKILETSIEKRYETILIVEDDCLFHENVKNIGHMFNYLPKDWDMLYFGGNHNLHIGKNPPEKINEFFSKLHSTYSAHIVGLKLKIYQDILDEISKLDKPLDVVYSEFQKKYNAISFSPGITSQLTNFSDIQNKIVDYNWLIK
jgi:GR25 family glycosyltransferase involved in LPS biosynthesis